MKTGEIREVKDPKTTVTLSKVNQDEYLFGHILEVLFLRVCVCVW